MNKNIVFSLAILGTILLASCERHPAGHDEHGHGDHGHEESEVAEQAKGPHGGRLFQSGDFAVEVTIYEPDIPPQSRVYVYEYGKPLDPSSVQLTTELHRINRIDSIKYHKQDDYLQGDIIVEEPHSFDVKLSATYKGKDYSWEYASYEGRTTISEAAQQASGIVVEKVGSARISKKRVLNGRVRNDAQKTASLTARFPGVVKEIRKLPGALVEKGDVLATVEANESLRSYEVISPRKGEVLAVHTSVGQVVNGTEPIVTVGDLSSIWVDLIVSTTEARSLQVGQKVIVPTGKEKTIAGKIIYVASVADGDTQTRLARAEVDNPEHTFVPETYVQAEVVTEERDVPVAIRSAAVQTFRDWNVAFVKVGTTYEIAILELGEVDGEWIEVISGLTPGSDYVSENSFVVKADVMKSGASHDH